MKIKEFVDIYNAKKLDQDKETFIKSHIVTNRVSYADKVDRAGMVARHTYYQKQTDMDGTEREVFHQNSAASYMLFHLTIVDLYTDIEIDYKESLEQFEMLDGEILDMIIAAIDERELQEFRMLLEFANDDIMVNEYEPHAFIRGQVERFSTLLGSLLAPAISQLDENKIEEVLNRLTKQ